jgi:hypothetical protein
MDWQAAMSRGWLGGLRDDVEDMACYTSSKSDWSSD